MAGFAVLLSLIASIALHLELSSLTRSVPVVSGRQGERLADRERERRAAREEFTKNFRELQLLGIGLLKTHERRDLRASRLSKDSKSIQKKAKALRSLTVLGEPKDSPKEYGPKIDSAQQFDRSIRELTFMIHRFAHNPIHKNSKIFDMTLASQAASDLVNIINLAKVIEVNADGYNQAANVK